MCILKILANVGIKYNEKSSCSYSAFSILKLHGYTHGRWGIQQYWFA